jgi:PAS domain S-box-containing protein
MQAPIYCDRADSSLTHRGRSSSSVASAMPLPDQLELQHLARVIESSDDAIVSKDLDGIIRSWNHAAERMFGYTAAEAIGRSIRMIIPEDRQNEEDTVLARIRAGQAVDHYETIRRRKDGTSISISLSVSPILDDSGVVVGASKIARDITERSRLVAVIQEQALIAEKLSEVGATVAASLDQEKIVQQVIDIATAVTHAENSAFFYNAVDAQSGEVCTLYASSGASLAPQTRPTTVFPSAFNGGGILRLDDATQDPRYGGNIPVQGMPVGLLPVRSYLAVPLKTPTGDILGGLFFSHSQSGVFTEQHEQLTSGISAWASLALENARLYVAARDSDRLKDEFLAVLSHELRTPLNAILGYARLLRGGILEGERAERGLETLERNATSLRKIVEDVLDVSRIVSGKIRLDVQPVELPLVIHNAVATVQPAADAKGVRLHTLIDPRVGPVTGDPDRLQQVVWNLLSNAVKFTPQQGRVHVQLARTDSHVEIVVSDTGAGIRPEFLPHVFERFRQAEAGTTRKTGGLGLGLSIVRHIVELHGGLVQASSEGEGHGATFRVRLPLMIVHPEGLTEARQHPLTEGMTPLAGLGDLSGIRVLAIDDDEDALALVQVILEAAGAEVTTFASAATALERIASVKPHVLVVDLAMPLMDGFEFIARLRASSNADVRDLPAAALTAFARSEDRTKALRSGFELHLAKPIDPGELAASVATLVRRSRRSGTEADS